ncbi:large proline-rich protein BAG6 [Perkinsela sp. CCAP 1560/4]|nr:large proline-rich protein BAG6 [Perkinsela sp. CCAP 1560/4]|eukprot:KNH07337.1 large proline-rich protein BAG6 [Perkinsela sp. CCAP 1560/4]
MSQPSQFPLQVRTSDARMHSIIVQHEWTVSTVKQHLKVELSRAYGPSSTIQYDQLSNERMRLLCKGRILADTNIVKDCLQSDVVCHLVVSPLEVDEPASPAADSAEVDPISQSSFDGASESSSMQSIANLLQTFVRDIGSSNGFEVSFEDVSMLDDSETGGQTGTEPTRIETTQNIPDLALEQHPDDTSHVQGHPETVSDLGSRSFTSSQLSDFQLPAASSLHLHVHVGINELDRVAVRGRRGAE